MTHLENYLDLLKGLPNDIQRNLNLVFLLDEKVTGIKARMQQDQEELLKLAKNHPHGDTTVVHPNIIPLLNRIRRDQVEAYALSQEKIELVKQNKFILDAYAQRLDEDVVKFREELGHEESNEASKKRDASMDYSVSRSRSASSARSTVGGRSQRTEQKRAAAAVPAEVAVDNNSNAPADVWCYCQQVSYGEMVACERGPKCDIEWFHYKCVDLKRTPKGAWYCKECREALGMEPIRDW